MDRDHGGLTAGQQVVLADLGQPLPSSASQADTRTRFGVGAFRGNFTGGPPGGFSGFGGSARTGN